jgi:hypothetical protein
MLNILYPQQTNRTLPAVLDSCTFYFCLALSIYKLSYFLLFVSLLNLFSSVLYFFIHLNILFFSLCIFSVLHNLSWYQSYRGKPLHTVGRATRSSQRRASRIFRSRDTDSFTRFGEQSVKLLKDSRKEPAEVAERTTLERTRKERLREKKL